MIFYDRSLNKIGIGKRWHFIEMSSIVWNHAVSSREIPGIHSKYQLKESWWYLSEACISLGQQKRCRAKDHAAWNAVKYSQKHFHRNGKYCPELTNFLDIFIENYKNTPHGTMWWKILYSNLSFCLERFYNAGAEKAY